MTKTTCDICGTKREVRALRDTDRTVLMCETCSITDAMTGEVLLSWQTANAALSTAAATLGAKGGAAKSKRKTRASRKNGKKGGRPSTLKLADFEYVGIAPRDQGQMITRSWYGDQDGWLLVITDRSDNMKSAYYHRATKACFDDNSFCIANGDPIEHGMAYTKGRKVNVIADDDIPL